MQRRSGNLDLLFQVLADPSRRRMLERLGRGPASLGQLAQMLGISLPGVTQHLRVMEESGLVRTRKVGRRRICALDPAVLRAAGRWIDGQIAWERRLDALAADLVEKDRGDTT